MGKFRTCSAPVCRSPPLYCYNVLPLDLHVLSLPLAFILSQDQTLHCKCFVWTDWFSLEIQASKFVCYFLTLRSVFLTVISIPFKDLIKTLPSYLCRYLLTIISAFSHPFVSASLSPIPVFRAAKVKAFLLPAKFIFKYRSSQYPKTNR